MEQSDWTDASYVGRRWHLMPVKVEAVIGYDVHARNLRILAYVLEAAKDEERHQLILEEFGNILDTR